MPTTSIQFVRATFVCLLAATVLSACSDGPAAPAASSKKSSDEVTLVNPGKLTVCTQMPYPPFQAFDDAGEPVGFDIEMVDLIAAELGVEQAIVDTPFEGIKSGQDLAAGKCDLAAAGMTITPERAEVILFSAPYYSANQALLVPSGAAIDSLEDLQGKRLGAATGTTGLEYANAHKDECGCEITEYADLAAQTQALTSGQVDAAIQDLPAWTDAIKRGVGDVTISAEFDTGEEYGFGLALDNTALKEVVDRTIEEAKSNGEYDRIYEKWIGDPPSE